MIRVFPRKTAWTPIDDMAFIGEPGLFRPDDRSLPVRISVTFTWDMTEAERIAGHWRKYYDDVQIGGPAYDSPAGEFVPGRFMKRGCTITTRGCPKRCKWCVVPQREGAMIELEIRAGWIVQDNNLFAASESHIIAVFDMLRDQDRNVFFTGGIDKHFLKPWHVELLKSIKVGELWLACDKKADVAYLRRTREMLGDSFKERQLRCYTMIGFGGESIADGEQRVSDVYEMGFLPFCQLYQPMKRRRIEYDREWRAVQKYWSRPAIYRSPANQRHTPEDD